MADTFKGVYSGNNGSLLKIRKGARTALRKPSVRHVPTEPGVIVPRLVVVPPPPPCSAMELQPYLEAERSN